MDDDFKLFRFDIMEAPKVPQKQNKQAPVASPLNLQSVHPAPPKAIQQQIKDLLKGAPSTATKASTPGSHPQSPETTATNQRLKPTYHIRSPQKLAEAVEMPSEALKKHNLGVEIRVNKNKMNQNI